MAGIELLRKRKYGLGSQTFPFSPPGFALTVLQNKHDAEPLEDLSPHSRLNTFGSGDPAIMSSRNIGTLVLQVYPPRAE
jgi:hypothetical protein